MKLRLCWWAASAAALTAALVSGCGDDSGDSGQKKSDAGTDVADGDAGAGGGPNPTYQACSSDAWCWELPKPQGNTLRGTWASGENDIWAVGDHGTILHWDGKGWAGLDAGTTQNLNAVWGSSKTDLWAVGDNATVLHWDGGAWTATTLPPADDAGPDAGAVTTDFYGVSGSKFDDVWAVGEAGAIWHYDGSAWGPVTSPAQQTLLSVWSAPTGEAWACGGGGFIFEWNGTAWTAIGQGTGTMRAIHGVDATLVAVASEAGGLWVKLNGTWIGQLAPGASPFRAVVAESKTKIWAFGDAGQTWTGEPDPTTLLIKWTKRQSATKTDLLAATPLDADSILSVGKSGVMQRWDGDARQLISTGSAANRLAITGAGAKDTWVVGDEVLHNQGSGWLPSEPNTDRALYDAFAVGTDDAWAVGTGGTILHYVGAAAGWTVLDSPTKEWLRGIWVTPTGGWIVGTKGTMLALLNQTSWVVTPSNTSADLNDVWIGSAKDSWAVGENGALLHWDGAAWAPYPLGGDAGTTATLRAVWGASATDAWAVGILGTIAHYDGKLWTVTKTGESYSLNDVWGSAAGDVYAVGTGGTILHWDGKAWTQQESGTSISLNSVWGPDAKTVYVAGESGALLKRAP